MAERESSPQAYGGPPPGGKPWGKPGAETGGPTDLPGHLLFHSKRHVHGPVDFTDDGALALHRVDGPPVETDLSHTTFSHASL